MNGEDLQVAMATFTAITLFVGAIVVMTAVWMRTAPRAALVRTDAALAEVDVRLTKVEGNITQIEANVRHLPTKDDVHTLEKAMLQLNATVERQGERMDGVLRGVDRIETYLLNTPAAAATPDRNHA